MKKSFAAKIIFSHYFKKLKNFSLGKIKMFKLSDDLPSSPFFLFSILGNKELEEIKLNQEDIIYYFGEFGEFFLEGEEVMALISAPLESNLLTKEKGIYIHSESNVSGDKYAIAIIEKKNGSLTVNCRYLNHSLPVKKGQKIIVNFKG